MRKKFTKRRIAALATFAIVVAVVAALLVVFHTPTVTLRIENDTSTQVTLSGCASDPATLSPGQAVSIDPNADDPHAACIVYRGETREVLGCLYIPTTKYHNHATVRVSRFERDVTTTSC